MELNDNDLLNLAKGYAESAIGFEGSDSELDDSRQTGAEYYKRKMRKAPNLPNRSKVVSGDTSAVIDQALADLVEIFLSEPTCVFNPLNSGDVIAAQQETDYVNHVFYAQNDGFSIIQKGFKDSLLMKRGYFMWQWVNKPPVVEHFKGKTADEHLQAMVHYGDDDALATMAQQTPGMPDQPPVPAPVRPPGSPKLMNAVQNDDGTWDYDIVTPVEGEVEISVWRPEDVCVSLDTEVIGEGRYCAFRSRLPRGQLLLDGYDKDLVMALPSYSDSNDQTNRSRSLSGEANAIDHGNPSDEMTVEVEVTYHYCRYTDENGEKLYRLVTGGLESGTLLKSEEVDSVPASSICPFPVPHNFFGESLADKLRPAQEQKTAILRAAFDQAYYAHSSRLVLPEDAMGKNTLRDLSNNQPGGYVRLKGATPPSMVQQLASGTMGYDPWQMLEYISTASEQATGIARASMGLNPDSLHETSSGMLAMLSVSQRRLRHIARNFAETGLKKLFLGIHDCLRRNASMPAQMRMAGNRFVPVDPTSWGVRQDMDVQIGGAHGGREAQIAALQEVLQLQQAAITAQQGSLDGPLFTPQHGLAAATKLITLMGVKNPESYFPDPAAYQPPPPQPPKPDPAMAKVQADAQADQQKLQLEAQKHADNHALNTQRVQNDAELRAQQMQLQHQLETYRIQLQSAQKQDQVEQEIALKNKEIEISTQLAAIQAKLADDNDKTRLDLEANQQAHDQTTNLIDLAHGHTMDAHAALNPVLPPVRPGGDASE